jgi:hypothetical protein
VTNGLGSGSPNAGPKTASLIIVVPAMIDEAA